MPRAKFIPCTERLPNTYSLPVMFELTNGHQSVGRYYTDEKKFVSSGFPKVKHPVEDVTGWKYLTTKRIKDDPSPFSLTGKEGPTWR